MREKKSTRKTSEDVGTAAVSSSGSAETVEKRGRARSAGRPWLPLFALVLLCLSLILLRLWYGRQPLALAPTGEAASARVLPTAGEAENRQGPLELNRATREELEALPGIGTVLADRILAYREEKGGFHSVEELTEVSGIGEKKLDRIRGLVYLEEGKHENIGS